MAGRRTTRGRNVNKGKLELSELVKRFDLHNRSDGKSEKTLRWYNQSLGLFQNWLSGEGMSTRLRDLGEDEVRHFIIHLQGRRGVRGERASSHTVNCRVRALRAFFAWLHRRGYTETNRLGDLRPPKVRQKEIEIMTDDEIERMFGCMDPDTELGARNTSIFSLMLDTGLRLSEVVTLKYGDVHLEEQYVKVLGKGDKERIVAFGANCRSSLLNYDRLYRAKTTEPGADVFFLCMDGCAMTSDALRSLTTRLAKSAGVLRLHPHLLRHTYATRFLLNGGDVFLLKQNLGHTTLAMVERYVHIANRMAAQVSQEFSPMDRFEIRGARPLRNSVNSDGWSGPRRPNAVRFGRGRSGVRHPSRKG